MRAPEIGGRGDRLTVISDAVFIPAVDHKEVRDGLEALAAIGELRRPRRILIGQQIHRRMDSDGVDGVGVDGKRRVGVFVRPFSVSSSSSAIRAFSS